MDGTLGGLIVVCGRVDEGSRKNSIIRWVFTPRGEGEGQLCPVVWSLFVFTHERYRRRDMGSRSAPSDNLGGVSRTPGGKICTWYQ